MTNLFIILFILLANIIAALLVYNCFGKKLDNTKKLRYTLIIIGAMYIISVLIYDLSTIGIEKSDNSSTLKTYLMMAFVPVNLIIFMPISIYSYIKMKERMLSMAKFKTRITALIIGLVVVLIGEFFYFRNSQKNISEYIKNSEQNNVKTSETVEEIEENNVDTNINNDITSSDLNSINNSTTNNEISNISNSIVNNNIIQNRVN